MKTLHDIITANCEYLKDVRVDVVSIYGTVNIIDLTGEHESIFLQGDEGSAFISEARQLWNEVGTVTIDDCHLHLAKPYIDCIWK